ncbi:hypothetical protein [Rhodococcus artemisiae]|uniref:Uncharacterized protein n=1 Tax=Rhodococcus artemisiae TaxID=714159 RepID=A0ABU7LAE5_9NOCA|nr:hypothetical protein [Rhodococcus artemisiae]MEE2058274.1 hypothetical protein [Rhodococcus artemisiae]
MTTRKPTAEQEQKYRRIVANAVDSGRISASRRGSWLNRMRQHPVATINTITALAPTRPAAPAEPSLPAWFS